MGGFVDLTGKVFGRLTVLKRLKNDKHNKARWLCLCECGKEVNIGAKVCQSTGLIMMAIISRGIAGGLLVLSNLIIEGRIIS